MTISMQRLAVACAVALVGSSSAARATEPTGVKLLRPDSLVGWDHSPQRPANWTIEHGRLTGNTNSTSLVGGWTLGDFELRFAWSVRDKGAWSLGLVDVPAGPGLQVALAEGVGCGAIRDGQQVLAPGATVDAASANASHTAVVRRGGARLSVIVDGRVVGETTVDRNRRFGLSLAVPAGEGTLSELVLEEPRGNPMFNGRDLTGWTPDAKGKWTVERGEIAGAGHRGNNYLRSDKLYANFTLTAEYKIGHGGNSGMAIRTPRGGWPSGDGMELQILDQPGEVKDSSMAIYGNLPPLDRADKPDMWNRVVIKADGWMISVWVNGEMVQQVNTSQLSELKHRHLNGWIGLQDHGDPPRFRELYVLEAPDGTGLDAWYAPRLEVGSAIVLDRVMNSERLSRDDGLTSGVVTTRVPKGGEHVLADLKGPGALVRAWHSYPSGRVALYFDGESQPRVECASEHLFDSVPGVSHEELPALVCAAYAKSLKIVLREPLESTYRVDYVTFPEGVLVDSFRPPRGDVPRGMLPAIIYRHEGLNHGRLREAEIYDRIHSEPRTIEPGTAVQLAALEGAGIVNWLKLQADKSVLVGTDLWIEVSIDGESLPAIAAPARFFYPALAAAPTDSADYNSLVMTSREGFANLLAMPYGNGLTVSVRNRGEKPIEKVAVTMSVARADAANRAEIAGRMRLRGVFQPAGSKDADLAHATGAGRFVALVYEQPDGATTGISSLIVDGQARDGWAAADLDAFFGRPGESKNFHRALSGHRGSLGWRYLLLEPVSFEQSLVLRPNLGDKLGGRLALFYVKP